jgi:hypothetical protein
MQTAAHAGGHARPRAMPDQDEAVGVAFPTLVKHVNDLVALVVPSKEDSRIRLLERFQAGS